MNTSARSPGLFLVFEGIDGSGKTTISNRVAKLLRERGLAVEHVREGGAFASSVTQGIRDFCRDARNLALVPRAELLLYVAREIQLLEEVLEPALGRADVVIADRYLYTAEVLAEQGRDLPDDAVRPIIDFAARGIWPDVVFLIDIDPSVARGRRKVAKLSLRDQRPASRKGLTGSGLQQRLREGYLALAARDHVRWVVIDNSDADLEEVIASVVEEVDRTRAGRRAPAGGPEPEPASLDPAPLAIEIGPSDIVSAIAADPGDDTPDDTPRIDGPRAALDRFLDWVDRRTTREPLLAAYVLAGLAGPEIDERRQALAARAPKIIARGLRGLGDVLSWRLRHQLLEVAPQEVVLSLVEGAAAVNQAWTLRELAVAVAPAEVATSLLGLDDETAWALRSELYDRAPDAVIGSLAMLDSPRAWELRERWLGERGQLETVLAGYPAARAAARSVMGVEGDAGWDIRKAARAAAPVPAIGSLRRLTSDRAWRWRDRALYRAPKAVLATIAGLDDERAWTMRRATAPRCREALDSMIGLDREVGWDLREACLPVFPGNVVRSLGVLVNGARGDDLLRRALALHPRNISLLKQAAVIATGAHLTPVVLAA